MLDYGCRLRRRIHDAAHASHPSRPHRPAHKPMDVADAAVYTRRPRPWHPPRLFPRVVCLDAGCGVVQAPRPGAHVPCSTCQREQSRRRGREGEREEGVRGGGGGVTS